MAAEGMDQLQRRIERLPNYVQAAVRAELEKQAEALMRIMRAGAPGGPTGALAASVRRENGKHKLQVVVAAGGPTTTTPYGYDYAVGVEFGNEHAPAQPFFYPAYRLQRKRIKSAVKRAGVKAIKENLGDMNG